VTVDPESVALHRELEAEQLVVRLTASDVMHLLQLLGESEADTRIADVLADAMWEQKRDQILR
jgi:hypothetical protein